MDLDRLVGDIKLALEYTSNLKTENDSLQNRINSLENHISTVESLLKEKETSYNELIDQKTIDENKILDKIISLQIDHKLKDDFKQLSSDYAELQDLYDKSLVAHNVKLAEEQKEADQRVDDVREEYGQLMSELMEKHEVRVKKSEEEICALKDQVQEAQRLRVEETSKVSAKF